MIGAALNALSICIFICGAWNFSPYSVRPCELTTKTRTAYDVFVSAVLNSGYQPAVIVSDFDSLSEKEKRDAIGGAIFYLILTGITAYLVTYRDTIKK